MARGRRARGRPTRPATGPASCGRRSAGSSGSASGSAPWSPTGP